jgi:hypothetical protein
MKALRITGIPSILVLCVGMALGQDAAHDVDKGAVKTGQVVRHVGSKAGHATKAGVKSAGHGSKIVAKDTAKGVKDAGHGTKVVAKDSAKEVKKGSKATGEGIKDAAAK